MALQAIAERFTNFLENHNLPEHVIKETTVVIKRVLAAVHNRQMVRDILRKCGGDMQNIDIALVSAYFQEGSFWQLWSIFMRHGFIVTVVVF